MKMSTVKISDVARSQYGFTASASASPVGPKFLRVTDIVPAQINWDAVPYCKIDYNQHQRYRLEVGDIVVARTGTVGHAKLIRKETDAVFASYLVRFKIVSEKLLSGYLGLIMESKVYRNYVCSALGGTAQPHVNAKKLGEFKFKMPPIQKQQQIVEIAENYNFLIENHRRRIALLEESARLLYREWFGNKRNLRATSPAQETLPTKPLAEIANLTMGQSPASKHYNKNGDGLPFHQGATSYGSRFVEDKVYSTHTTKIAMPGDILLSVRAPVGRINITKNKIVLGRGLAAINSKAGFNSFLFYALKSFFFKEDIIGTGSIYAAVTKSQLEKVEIFYPPEEKIKRFESVVVPIDRKISNLYRQIQLLIKARDLLLPRLMDGRIKP